jgi:hypothetical protein
MDTGYPISVIEFFLAGVIALNKEQPNEVRNQPPDFVFKQIRLHDEYHPTKLDFSEASRMINPALKTALTWKGDIKSDKKLGDTYQQCKHDVENAKNDTKKFVASLCGAEITGYMAALFASDRRGDRIVPTPACKKEVEHIYDELNAAKTACIDRSTSPLDAGKKFVSLVEDGLAGKKTYFESLASPDNLLKLKGYGAAGEFSLWTRTFCPPN